MADDSITQKKSGNHTFPQKMSHKKWRAHLRKLKRKAQRTEAAKNRDLEEKDGNFETDSEEDTLQALAESENIKQNQLWLERERQAQLAFQAKIEWEEKEKRKKEETERKIKEEWEERERKERDEKEEKEKREQERRDKQDKLLKEATANENTEAWHNPIAPVQYSQQRQVGQERQVEPCPFFKKTATCRFGDQCSRFHDHPDSSCTILLHGMFSCFELEQSVVDNQDTDIGLEYDENDMYHSFKDFYDDVLPEFQTVGVVRQFKVCCNYEPHLRGNVYVQFGRESSAQAAFQKFNARWYGGKQLSCRFVNIESWRAAICGLAFRKRCPKGKACNFLHVFRNPSKEFCDMDQDLSPSNQRRENSHRAHRHEHRGGREDRSSQSQRESVRSQYHSHHRSRRPSYTRSRSRSPKYPSSSSSRSHRRRSVSRDRSRAGSSRDSVKRNDRRRRRRARSNSNSSDNRSNSNSPVSPQSSRVSPSRDRKSEQNNKNKRQGRRKGRSRSRSEESSATATVRQVQSRSRSRSQSPIRIRSRSRSQSRLRVEKRERRQRIPRTRTSRCILVGEGSDGDDNIPTSLSKPKDDEDDNGGGESAEIDTRSGGEADERAGHDDRFDTDTRGKSPSLDSALNSPSQAKSPISLYSHASSYDNIGSGWSKKRRKSRRGSKETRSRSRLSRSRSPSRSYKSRSRSRSVSKCEERKHLQRKSGWKREEGAILVEGTRLRRSKSPSSRSSSLSKDQRRGNSKHNNHLKESKILKRRGKSISSQSSEDDCVEYVEITKETLVK